MIILDFFRMHLLLLKKRLKSVYSVIPITTYNYKSAFSPAIDIFEKRD